MSGYSTSRNSILRLGAQFDLWGLKFTSGCSMSFVKAQLYVWRLNVSNFDLTSGPSISHLEAPLKSGRNLTLGALILRLEVEFDVWSLNLTPGGSI